MKRYAVIVAGGSGTRMGADVPKQFLVVKNQPVLMHTIETFHRFDEQMELIVVLPQDQIAYWDQLCKTYHFSIQHRVIAGGETRFHSVKNGLSLVKEPALVGIHDGVRPLVSSETLQRCYHHAEALGNAIPVIDAFESVRHLGDKASKALDRSKIKLVQTPQVFHSDLLLRAYEVDFNEKFTDDASVVEASGHIIHLVAGNRENIKITTPLDLKIAELFLESFF
ncbi:2-C-methyl-D-erythritol 4-phosphate cytidylyltransferase [Marinilabiliaceae bacterium JC017]|nr:2-C-methyl-D-erythritol 4-phosphate cytidylyltransferase [Marinilabiliaceae bacterium JC017]